MVHIGHVSDWVQYVARNYTLSDLLGFAEECGWLEDEGVKYIDLTSSGFLAAIGGQWFDPKEAMLELVKVEKPLDRHQHMGSDTAVVVLGVTDQDDHEFWSDRSDEWELAYDRQVVVIPRGSIHGFRPDNSGEPFYLLVAANPPIADDDTVFV